MEHTKSKYLIWLETLHREYTDQTNITLFGKQAMLIKLLADMYEVKLRFKNVLAKLKNKTLIVLDDDDVNYKEWYDPNKWKINSTDLKDEDIVETLGVNNTEDISFSFANLLTDIFKNDISKINNDRFRGLVSTLFVFNTIVDEKIVKKALDNELIQLQEILVKIDTEKNKSKSPEEYADYFKKIKEDILNFMEKAKIKIEHQEWINGIIDVDMEDLKERRVKLLLDIFDSHFLDKFEYHKNADDPIGFNNYDFDNWKDRMDEAIKDFAKLKKICPYNDDMIDFSKDDKMGKYILVKKIPSNALNCFLKNMQLIILVQEEMRALNAQKIDEEGDKLHSNEAKQLWEKCKEMQWIDDNLQPKVSEPKAAVIASVMSGILNLSPRWEAFENLWGIKEMPNKLCKAQNAKYYPEFFKTVEKKLA